MYHAYFSCTARVPPPVTRVEQERVEGGVQQKGGAFWPVRVHVCTHALRWPVNFVLNCVVIKIHGKDFVASLYPHTRLTIAEPCDNKHKQLPEPHS